MKHIAFSIPQTSKTSAMSVTEIIWASQGWGLVFISFLCFFPGMFHVAEYLFFALLVLAIGIAWREGRPIWVRSPMDLPLLFFVSWVLFTIPFAGDPFYSFGEWQKLVAQVFVFYWVLFIIRVHNDNSLLAKEHGKRRVVNVGSEFLQNAVLVAILLGTLILCLSAFFDFVFRGGTWKDRFVRAAAPHSDYNWLSTYMVMATPILISAVFVFRGLWQRVATWGVVVFAFGAQVFSYTRAGWLGLVTQGLAFGFFTRRRWLVLSVIGGLIIIVSGLVTVSQFGYQQDTVDSRTLMIRIEVWQLGFDEILRHPILGLGYGYHTFSAIVSGFPNGSQELGLHNTFLMVGVGSGLPALALLVWILVQSVQSLVGATWREAILEKRAIMLATAIMVVGFAVRNFFDYMFAGSLAYLFWILLATGFSVGVIGNRQGRIAYASNS